MYAPTRTRLRLAKLRLNRATRGATSGTQPPKSFTALGGPRITDLLLQFGN